jgi:hypothetical protein
VSVPEHCGEGERDVVDGQGARARVRLHHFSLRRGVVVWGAANPKSSRLPLVVTGLFSGIDTTGRSNHLCTRPVGDTYLRGLKWDTDVSGDFFLDDHSTLSPDAYQA